MQAAWGWFSSFSWLLWDWVKILCPARGVRAAATGISQLVALLFNQGSCSCFSGHANAFISESSVLIHASDVHHALNKTLGTVAVAQSWWQERRACLPSPSLSRREE